ncbi:MAG: LuxR C-terminal-related transcriptional regulator, partial [Chloroflexota bacterium]
MTVSEITLDLTEREIEILELLNEGLKNKEIATRTHLTLYTVKWYLKQIYSKLYVSNRTQAASKARELGLFQEDAKRTSREMAAIRTNLPESVMPFFGREGDIEQVKDWLLGDMRLVTLHGIGGMGKTRLALEVGHRLLPAFTDGVYFISLTASDINPLHLLADTLTLNASGTDVTAQVATYLHNKHMLLIFDNFEHLLPYATEISHLLEQTRNLRIIVTSREILNLSHEVVIPLQGLTSEDSDAAYQLYIQRARSSIGNYTPDSAESAYIHKICKLVGGMPLAIEMVAGWVSVMSAAETYERVKRNIDLLTSDEHDRPQRHQSIRAIFDYSLESLPYDLKQAVIKLGIFHYEGFTLKDAEAVADLSPLALRQLTQAALLQRDTDGRFKFHPLIRQYITALLRADETLYSETKDAHGAHYFKFSEYLVDQLNAPNFSLRLIDEFRAGGGNLLLAWRHALRQGYYDWLLSATEVGYITEMAGNWDLSLKMYYDTLAKTPESETLLRGRLLALISVFEGRLYYMERLETSARESWELLKDSDYVWDARAAMQYLALLKAIMGAGDEAFAILDKVDAKSIPSHLQPNAYVDSLNRIARPLALMYTHQLEQARPLLERAKVPTWSESVIYLPECYYLLGMEDKAHQSLVRLYTAALDNRNHRLAQMIVLYLTLLEHDDADIPNALTHNLRELINIGFKYQFIVRNGFYFGVMSMMRGLQREAFYSWYGAMRLLD